MVLACQSCTNRHEVGCTAGGGARVQGWLGHSETEPGNPSGQGAPAQEQDTQPGVSLHVPTPAPHSRPGQERKARADLPISGARCPASVCPTPPCQDTHCSGQPRSQGHFQVPLKPQQSRHQDEDFCHLLEYFPVLQGENRTQEFQCPEGLVSRLNREPGTRDMRGNRSSRYEHTSRLSSKSPGTKPSPWCCKQCSPPPTTRDRGDGEGLFQPSHPSLPPPSSAAL